MTYGQPNPLIGKTIVGIDIAESRQAIRFRLSDGTDVVALADGDCCSHTWIEGVDTPGAILGYEVTGVEDIPMPDPSPQPQDDDYGDVTAFYGLRILTRGGGAVVDYRNSSNGYYGGNLVWPGESYYGGVYGQNVDNAPVWKAVEK